MTTEERFEKLELELAAAKRLIRQLMAGAGSVLLVCIVCMVARSMTGVAHSQEEVNATEVIRSKKFEVVDDQGKTRAFLGITDVGSILIMKDETGKPLAWLSVTEDDSRLVVEQKTSKRRASLVASEYNTSLDMYDKTGKGRAWLTVSEDGPVLSIGDKTGKGRASLGVSTVTTSDGKSITYPESTILLFGPNGRVLWQAP